MSETLLLPKSGRFLPDLDTVPEPCTALVPVPIIAKTHRRIDVETTPGRCGNLDYCSIGRRRGLVRVAVSRAFVCPECGSPLRAPRVAGQWRARLLPLARSAFLLGGVAAGLVIGYMAGRAQAPVALAAWRMRQAAADRLAIASDPPARPAPVAPIPVAETPAPDPLLPEQVTFRAWPGRAGTAAQSAPRGRLLHEARTGQVIVDCTLGALVTRPVCTLAASHGQDAFSAAALAWLGQMRVQYAPAPDSTSPALPDHRWRVVFEDYAGQAKRANP